VDLGLRVQRGIEMNGTVPRQIRLVCDEARSAARRASRQTAEVAFVPGSNNGG